MLYQTLEKYALSTFLLFKFQEALTNGLLLEA